MSGNYQDKNLLVGQPLIDWDADYKK